MAAATTLRGAPKRRRRRRPRTSSWRPPQTRNPLEHRTSASRRWSYRLLVAAGTLGLHAIGLGGFAVAALIFPEPPHVLPDGGERVELRVFEPPPPVESTTSEAPSPVVAPAEPKPQRRAPPPPDPVDIPPEVATPSPEPRRRIVGLSFESTVSSGGDGPSFATGNTRMGATAQRASEPGAAPKLSPNRAATRLPAGTGTFTKPARVAPVEPAYPELLRARGVEADVVVFISISADGGVGSARVVKGSQHPEFNDAALAAARAQRFTPATRNGEAVPYSLKYTYRFRLDRT